MAAALARQSAWNAEWPQGAQMPRTSPSAERQTAHSDDIYHKKMYLCDEPEIAHGKSATVHAGARIESGEPVAIKRYKARTSEHELEILRHLGPHPRLARFIEHLPRDHGWLVFDLYARSLHDVLVREPDLARRRAKKFARQMLQALKFVHAKGVVHGDVKGENLLLDAAGDLRLCDFGISHMDTCWVPDCDIVTVNYRAPELLRGEMYDESIDVWAAACVVYEFGGFYLSASNTVPGVKADHEAVLGPEPTRRFSAPDDVAALCRAALVDKHRPTARQLLKKHFAHSPAVIWLVGPSREACDAFRTALSAKYGAPFKVCDSAETLAAALERKPRCVLVVSAGAAQRASGEALARQALAANRLVLTALLHNASAPSPVGELAEQGYGPLHLLVERCADFV